MDCLKLVLKNILNGFAMIGIVGALIGADVMASFYFNKWLGLPDAVAVMFFGFGMIVMMGTYMGIEECKLERELAAIREGR